MTVCHNCGIEVASDLSDWAEKVNLKSEVTQLRKDNKNLHLAYSEALQKNAQLRADNAALRAALAVTLQEGENEVDPKWVKPDDVA